MTRLIEKSRDTQGTIDILMNGDLARNDILDEQKQSVSRMVDWEDDVLSTTYRVHMIAVSLLSDHE